MELNISKEQRDHGLVIISVGGRLNAITTGELKTSIKASIEESFVNMILVLNGTTFIDSSGLSAIVSALKGVREKNGSLKLVGVIPNVKKVFELTHLDRIFEFYDTVDQALAAT